MSNFISNAEMSLNLFKRLMQNSGKPLTPDQENHFKTKYAPVLNKLDNDFDDSLGLPRLTELKSSQTFPEIFEAFKDGKYIIRDTWSPGIYLHKKNSTAILESHDLLADNWMILEL